MPLNLSSLTAQQQAAAIYIGYYDRAPDPDGSTFWEGVVTAGNLSLAEIAADFSTQAETRAEHPFFVDPTAGAANAFISELYMNLFNRAPDADGLEFWSDVLQASIDGTGALSVGQIILEIIQGAQDTADGNDLTTIENKIAVAKAWTDEAETAGLTGADAYANDAAAQASAKSILDGVTDDSATVTAAESEAAGFFAEEQTFTLTAGIDDFTGAAGGDTFSATAATLQSGDELDGGAGTDTLTIKDVTGASESGLAAATISNIEKLSLTATGGVGTEGGSATTQDGEKEVTTITLSGDGDTTAVTEIVMTVGSTTYSSGALGSGSGVGDQSDIDTAVRALLNDAFGDSVTLGNLSSDAFTVTAKSEGTAIPDFSFAVTGTAGSATVKQTTDAAETIVNTGSDVAPVQTITIDAGGATDGLAAADTVYAHVDGVRVAAYTGDATPTAAEAATAVASQINALVGSDIASATGGTVTILGTAGEPLPLIGVSIDDDTGATTGTAPSTSTSIVRQSSDTVDAAGSAVVYDATGFADDVNMSAQGDVNTKVADTAAATITTSDGSVSLEGGLTANITATDEVTVEGNELTDVTVKTGTASGDTVTIGGTTAATDTPLLETATVTGGNGITVNDSNGTASQETLTTVNLNEFAGTATLTGDAIANVNLGKQTTSSAVVDVVNGSTTTSLNLSLADTGVTATGTSATLKAIVDAETLNVVSNGTSNDIDVESNSSSLTAVNVSGAGKLAIELDASTTAVEAFNGSAATGDITIVGLEAAAVDVKTGSGDDTFTTTATAAMTVDAGAGDDAVTLGSALAKGSTVDLGAGDDSLLSNSSGSVDLDDASSVTNAKITTIDAGDGVDTLAASLVTAGNADQFVNFEVLGLDLGSSDTLDTNLISGLTSLELLATGGTYTNVDLSQSLAVKTTVLSGTTTLTFEDVTGASDSYAINFDGDNSAATTAPTSANYAAGAVVTDGVENISIDSGGSQAWNSITLGGNDDAETVTISGASNLDLAFASGFGSTTAPATGVSSIDGSAATGKLDINTTNVTGATAGLTVKGGSADDTIVLTQEATVEAGAGDDTITVADHATTTSGGAGKDTFEVANAVGSDDIITITDIEAGDIIDFGNATTFNATAVDVSSATTLEAAIGLADGTSSTASADADDVSYFDYSGDTYVVLAGNDNTAITDDTVVKLVGTFDLEDSTLASDALTIV